MKPAGVRWLGTGLVFAAAAVALMLWLRSHPPVVSGSPVAPVVDPSVGAPVDATPWTPADLRAEIDAACAVAARSGKCILCWCRGDDRQQAFTDDSARAFQHEVWNDPVAGKALAGIMLGCEVVAGDGWRIADLPESLRTLASVTDGKLRFRYQLVVLDREGRVFVLPEKFAPGGGKAFVAEMLEVAQRERDMHEALAYAATRTGRERAMALAAALGIVDEQVRALSFADELAEIVTLDADGSLGLRDAARQTLDQHLGERINVELMGEFGDVRGVDPERVEARLQPFRERYGDSPAAMQRIELFAAVVLAANADHPLLIDRAVRRLETAKALQPDSELVPRIDRMVARLRARREH